MHGCAFPTSATICMKTSPHIKLRVCVCACDCMCVSVHQTGEEKNNPIIETVCLTDIQYSMYTDRKRGVCMCVCVLVKETNKDEHSEEEWFLMKRTQQKKGENKRQARMNECRMNTMCAEQRWAGKIQPALQIQICEQNSNILKS